MAKEPGKSLPIREAMDLIRATRIAISLADKLLVHLSGVVPFSASPELAKMMRFQERLRAELEELERIAPRSDL